MCASRQIKIQLLPTSNLSGTNYNIVDRLVYVVTPNKTFLSVFHETCLVHAQLKYEELNLTQISLETIF